MNSKIYVGEVMHSRLAPVKHSFRYPVYFYAFDLDELSQLAASTPLFGYNQLRPVALHIATIAMLATRIFSASLWVRVYRCASCSQCCTKAENCRGLVIRPL